MNSPQPLKGNQFQFDNQTYQLKALKELDEISDIQSLPSDSMRYTVQKQSKKKTKVPNNKIYESKGNNEYIKANIFQDTKTEGFQNDTEGQNEQKH